jgi:hypothetical protein
MNVCPDCAPHGRCVCPPARVQASPTPAEALRGLLAVLPVHLLHDLIVVEAVKRARAALK